MTAAGFLPPTGVAGGPIRADAKRLVQFLSWAVQVSSTVPGRHALGRDTQLRASPQALPGRLLPPHPFGAAVHHDAVKCRRLRNAAGGFYRKPLRLCAVAVLSHVENANDTDKVTANPIHHQVRIISEKQFPRFGAGSGSANSRKISQCLD